MLYISYKEIIFIEPFTYPIFRIIESKTVKVITISILLTFHTITITLYF